MGTSKVQGGGLNFSKMSQFQLFDSIYAILPLYEMSEIQKCPNLIRGGGQQFSKMSEIQKSLKFPMGGGVKPIWEFFPNFSVFFL